MPEAKPTHIPSLSSRRDALFALAASVAATAIVTPAAIAATGATPLPSELSEAQRLAALAWDAHGRWSEAEDANDAIGEKLAEADADAAWAELSEQADRIAAKSMLTADDLGALAVIARSRQACNPADLATDLENDNGGYTDSDTLLLLLMTAVVEFAEGQANG